MPEPLRFAPSLEGAAASAWEDLAGALLVATSDPAKIDALTASLSGRVSALPAAARARFTATARVALDLARQGWTWRESDGLWLTPPDRVRDALAEKARVRAQLHVERDRQLQKPSVREFLRRMETRRLWRGRWLSVFDLMRDGEALAAELRAANTLPDAPRAAALAGVIQPYLPAVDERSRCAHTGLPLREIWRYFRHTWATPYNSVPGRGLCLLVRDAAAPLHPVIGVAMLTSAPAQIACRDAWIGWMQQALLGRLRASPTDVHARWIAGELDRMIAEIYVQDLLVDGLITPATLQRPDADTLERLRAEGRRARGAHARFARGQDHKHSSRALPADDDGWAARARTSLFRGKRALLLADLLDARRVFAATLGEAPDAEGLAALLGREEGRRAARTVLRRAKADRMGVALAEISVCGAIAPYNELLGGKLVALLTASPSVQAIYKARYGDTPSLIASSMAGRAIVRGAHLSLLTTASLFHVASAQYNRLTVPTAALGGPPGRALRYEELGLTAGYGTSQYSRETVEALVRLASQASEGRRVNSIFGEGVNPRLRKVREGLDLLGLPSDQLLQHGSPRRVYGVALVENLTDSLLGVAAPAALIPDADPRAGTEALIDWWRRRWLDGRARREEVLSRVEAHRLSRPVRHGARVPRPQEEDEPAPTTEAGRQISLFGAPGVDQRARDTRGP